MKEKKYIKIIGFMKKIGLSNGEFANLIEMSRVSLYGRLIGKISFKSNEMLAIQKLLNKRLKMNLSIEELFFE